MFTGAAEQGSAVRVNDNKNLWRWRVAVVIFAYSQYITCAVGTHIQPRYMGIHLRAVAATVYARVAAAVYVRQQQHHTAHTDIHRPRNTHTQRSEAV